MLKPGKKRMKKIGLPPGTPVYIGDRGGEVVKITTLDFDETQFQETDIKEVEECFSFKDTPTVTWINVDGIHDIENIEKIGRHFGIHPLVQEDIVHTEQRPKMEEFEDYIYIVLKMMSYNEKNKETVAEQVSLILGKSYVISFQERQGDIFDSLRERIRIDKGRIRKMGADYLAYSLLDTIVDYYFVVLEKLGDRVEELEDELVSHPRPEDLQEVHRLKREMIFLRKSVWPLREVISGLERLESSLVEESTKIYLRDVYDHSIQIMDIVETNRDMLSGMHDTYLSSISNRMNEIMKVLTIIATIFIPLTFIAGVY
ncbi:MAG: magnesium/cobalt transporter CorA, partial [Candidatus Aminicenantes bacterium]|nr:magnesium/cobalt transporter CorA [Candidatus Aminicenantes bacterium]